MNGFTSEPGYPERSVRENEQEQFYYSLYMKEGDEYPFPFQEERSHWKRENGFYYWPDEVEITVHIFDESVIVN